MKSKFNEIVNNFLQEGHEQTISIEVPLKLWKHALNAHKVPNTADVLAAIMGDIVNLHNKKTKAAEQESKEYQDYWNKRDEEGTGF